MESGMLMEEEIDSPPAQGLMSRCPHTHLHKDTYTKTSFQPLKVKVVINNNQTNYGLKTNPLCCKCPRHASDSDSVRAPGIYTDQQSDRSYDPLVRNKTYRGNRITSVQWEKPSACQQCRIQDLGDWDGAREDEERL